MPGIRDMYKKSILFEIVEKENPDVPIKAFTLTIPPESFDIEENQRISETETFGGVFLDDYGEGLKPIKISGNTGGATLRLTYCPANDFGKKKEFNGRTAFYYFRNELMRYKSLDSLKGKHRNYDLRIYDLSTCPSMLDFTKGSPETEAEGYICYLKRFKMSRSKEKPLFYNYSIELTAVKSLGIHRKYTPEPVSSRNDPRKLIHSIRRGLRLIKGYFTYAKNIMSAVDNILGVVNDLENQLNAFISHAGDLVYYPFALASRAFLMVNDLGSLVEAAHTEIVETQGRIASTYYGVLSAMRETTAVSAALVSYAKISGTTESVAKRLENEDSRIASGVKRFDKLSEEEAEVTLSSLNQVISNEKIYRIYGYVLVTADQSATFERLSVRYYGSVDFIELIAVFNKIKSDAEIVVGNVLRIPVLVKGEISEQNYIYSEARNDIYGSDIKLDKGSDIVAMASGDIVRIEGIANLVQAVNLKLNTHLGSRFRLTVYGLRDSIGFALGELAPVAYIVTSIKETLIQDPRIDKTDEIRMRVSGDVLDTSLNIHSIKVGEVIPFKGGIT